MPRKRSWSQASRYLPAYVPFDVVAVGLDELDAACDWVDRKIADSTRGSWKRISHSMAFVESCVVVLDVVVYIALHSTIGWVPVDG